MLLSYLFIDFPSKKIHVYIFSEDPEEDYLLRVVSLGTGSKCIGQSKMSKEGKSNYFYLRRFSESRSSSQSTLSVCPSVNLSVRSSVRNTFRGPSLCNL